MSAPIFVGDEWSAAGFRLAGCRTLVAEPDTDPEPLLTRALAEAPSLLLLGAALARRVDPNRLDGLRRDARPPLLVVADPAGRRGPEPVTRRVRHRMGVAE